MNIKSLIFAGSLLISFNVFCQSTLGEQLIDTIKNNNIENVKNIIKQGADVNFKDKKANTALIYAVQASNKELVELLLSNNADVNLKKEKPVYSRETEKFFKLIGKNLDEDFARYANIGNPALIHAVKACDKEIAQIIIKNGAEINMQNKYGYTALAMAAQNADKELVELLIQNKADVNFFCACPQGIGTTIYESQEKRQAKERKKLHGTALTAAIKNGHNEILSLLIKNGADVNLGSALNTAIELENIKIIKTLIANGANVNLASALNIAIELGNIEIVKILISNAANINLEKDKPLSLAAYFYIISYIQSKQAIPINTLNSLGDNLTEEEKEKKMFDALALNDKEINKILIDIGAKVNSKNKASLKHMSFAINFCILGLSQYYQPAKEIKKLEVYLEIVQILLKNGAKLNNNDIENLKEQALSLMKSPFVI